MGRRVVIPWFQSAAAGEEDTVDLYKVPNGRVLKIDRIDVHFPPGTACEMEIALYVGDVKIYPTTGTVVGDGVTWRDPVSIALEAGSTIRLWYRNNSTTDVRKVIIHILGELE